MELLTNTYILTILLGAAIVGATAGYTGVFIYLRKSSLLGDALSHGVLPGICIGFLIAGEKNPVVLFICAFLSGLVCAYFIDFISRKSKLKPDSALAIGLSFSFAIGIVLLSLIQNSGNAAQSGLDAFLFGKAAAMNKADVIMIATLGLVILSLSTLFKKRIKVYCFNPEYGTTLGFKSLATQTLITGLVVATISVGLQAVGVILISALLVTPATIARLWTKNYTKLLLLATIIGAVNGFAGAWVSAIVAKMPTGPWIVVFLTFCVFVSVVFAPYVGALAKYKRQQEVRKKIKQENILKTFFHLSEQSGNSKTLRSLNELAERCGIELQSLQNGLYTLIRKGFVEQNKQDYFLSDKGIIESNRIVRLHRLWELYLTNRLNLPADHVHPDAEAMEHVITPELEALLLKDLENPNQDPHNKIIPS